VTVSPPAATPQFAPIHAVTCAEYASVVGPEATPVEIEGTAVNTVVDVRDGKSTTTVPGSLADRTTGEFSIIVHEPDAPYAAVACGDIPTS
jgi:hypothetical protein